MAFSVKYASVGEYRLFASTIRSRAAQAREIAKEEGHGETGAYFLPARIQLSGLFVELYIELRVRNPGLRIVGFRNTFETGQAPPQACFRHVRDSSAPPGIHRAEALPFDGGRSALEAAAGVRRTDLSLGRRPMINSIVWLHRNRDPRCTAQGILVLSEMLCEAARFPVLADRMSRIWMTGGQLTAASGVVA
ncbi:ribosome-inactivating family protein [Streptomyces sp. NPDC058655]|uniref:ribosome-inactivating family protein n=1 Tax=Streptomyces sp. NPDC058655 TaxID=3346577 RepID=UPI0036696A2C